MITSCLNSNNLEYNSAKHKDILENNKIVNEFILNTNDFIKNYKENFKTKKQLNKQYNLIAANIKKVDNAIIFGQLNHTISKHLYSQYINAKNSFKNVRNCI